MPFTDVLNVKLEVEKASNFSISLFDLQGRKVNSILEEDYLNPQEHSFVIESNQLPNGVYYLKIQAAQGVSIKKVILNR